MKAMSEFPVHVLTKGLAVKAALTAEGKTEEEVSTTLGETFKFKDNRLKYFMTALSVAETNLEKLYRVRVFTFSEGEKIPEKAMQVEELHYVPEFFNPTPGAKPVTEKPAPGARGGAKKNRPKGPKSSPWGLSPEEIAAKKEASLRAAAAKAPK
jgi:hypothetical protein